MSVSGHEAAAQHEQEIAALHSGQYDARVTRNVERCLPPTHMPLDQPCWDVQRNPTRSHLEEAQKHLRLGDEHRAAARTLLDAEARACVGVSELDRDMSPFEHPEDLASVTRMTGRSGGTKGGPPVERTEGARIVFHDVRGLDASALQRIIDCHVARNVALGHSVPEMPSCPLVPDGISVQVNLNETGHIVVEVRASNPVVASEVWRRAMQLKGQ